ncbi:MAG: PEP-CTERM sorting domain-containing protein [Bryobacteraceae bacterium]
MADTLMPEASASQLLAALLANVKTDSLVVAPSSAHETNGAAYDHPGNALLESSRIAYTRSNDDDERDNNRNGNNNNRNNNDDDDDDNDNHPVTVDDCDINIYCHDGNCGNTPPAASTVPEPVTMGLTGAGLMSIYFIRRRRK